jgi:hypothetical protein
LALLLEHIGKIEEESPALISGLRVLVVPHNFLLLVSSQHQTLLFLGGSTGTRTLNRRIKSPMLYQLSYRPKFVLLVGALGVEPSQLHLR